MSSLSGLESDPKSEIEISVRESPLDDLRDEGFFVEPSSEAFDFLRLVLGPVGGISCDDRDPGSWLDPRWWRWREPLEDSWLEESAEGSEERLWRRVAFCLGASGSMSIELCRDLGIKWLRILERLEFDDAFFSRSVEMTYSCKRKKRRRNQILYRSHYFTLIKKK